MPHPTCKCCYREFPKRGDNELCSTCLTAYEMATDDVVAWFKAMFPECHGIIHRIQGGETKGFRGRATAKGAAQKVGRA